MAAAHDPRTRRAAARIMHLLPDESYLPALVPLVDDPDEPSPTPPGARCAASSGPTSGAPPSPGSPPTGRHTGAKTPAAG